MGLIFYAFTPVQDDWEGTDRTTSSARFTVYSFSSLYVATSASASAPDSKGLTTCSVEAVHHTQRPKRWSGATSTPFSRGVLSYPTGISGLYAHIWL